MKKPQLVQAIALKEAADGKKLYGGGVVEISKQGHGYARSHQSSYLPGEDDLYVSPSLIAKHELKTGQDIEGEVVMVGDKLRIASLDKICGADVRRIEHPDFDALTADFPRKQILLEHSKGDPEGSLGLRMIDLLVPIGFGQRALIIAPPKSGKTMLMQSIACSIKEKYPDCILMVLLVDERPEEVTEMRRRVEGAVISSSFDESPEHHIRVAEMTLHRAKRFAERGRNVVVILDSLTRLARAYNVVLPSSGRVLSGGMDANAMHKPKYLFGAARNLKEGGSITIIATVLVETGSKMDEVIAEDLIGRGNCDIFLRRALATRGIFPSMDPCSSGTRNDKLLEGFDKRLALEMMKSLSNKPSVDAMELLISKMKAAASNEALKRILMPRLKI